MSLMKKALALLDQVNERGTVAVHLQSAIDAIDDKTVEERQADAAALRERLFPSLKD
ncbi:hypothetical protein VVT58_22955 (plasmid) [Sphingobium sp. SJ10-10]|uniref:hypothetical protein n=1 Tax=unclassified Sphingobium TaxID=2611147 RepID=UPI0013149C9F|nr:MULTISPECIES: hypothetical protein [unclassified Sphingobium]MEC6699452.1 hypothetical protein [Sphingobium sp. SJ10-10]NML91307.1 hypothetical protein [Sphingobium sp. TB-6]